MGQVPSLFDTVFNPRLASSFTPRPLMKIMKKGRERLQHSTGNLTNGRLKTIHRWYVGFTFPQPRSSIFSFPVCLLPKVSIVGLMVTFFPRFCIDGQQR